MRERWWCGGLLLQLNSYSRGYTNDTCTSSSERHRTESRVVWWRSMKSFNDLPKILPRFIIKRNMLLSFLAISGVVVGSISVLRGEDRTQRLLG